MKRSILLPCIVLAILALTGCQFYPAIPPTAAEVVDIDITVQPTDKPAPQATLLPEPTQAEPASNATSQPAYPDPLEYPVPGAAYPLAAGPYVAPEGSGAPTLEAYVFKASQPGTATLHGWLVVTDPLVLLPAPEDAIYLVPLIGQEGAPMTIPPIERDKNPQAEVDERTGEFRFTNIQPGQYAVVIVTNGGSEVPARNYETGNFTIITIEAADIDKIKDLGHLAL